MVPSGLVCWPTIERSGPEMQGPNIVPKKAAIPLHCASPLPVSVCSCAQVFTSHYRHRSSCKIQKDSATAMKVHMHHLHHAPSSSVDSMNVCRSALSMPVQETNVHSPPYKTLGAQRRDTEPKLLHASGQVQRHEGKKYGINSRIYIASMNFRNRIPSISSRVHIPLINSRA